MAPTPTNPIRIEGPALARHAASEWVLSNALGGFAMGTVSGVPMRRYHGLLVAATRPPLGRVAALMAVDDAVLFEGEREREPRSVPLTAFQFVGNPPAAASPHLTAFEHDAGACRWEFSIPQASIPPARLSKEVVVAPGGNATVVRYTLNGQARRAWIRIRPLVALRDFHRLVDASRGLNQYRILDVAGSGEARVAVEAGGVTLHLSAGRDARWAEKPEWWFRFEYPMDRARGDAGREDLLCPGTFLVELTGEAPSVELRAWIGDAAPDPWAKLAEDRRAGVAKVVSEAPPPPVGLAAVHGALLRAADQFLVARPRSNGRPGRSIIAGYPWFADWGRDTMIALRGLLLSTRRFDEARSVLSTFAEHRHQGLIPNCFDDDTGRPRYNSIDASLWFIHASCDYAQASGDGGFLKDVLVPACLDAVEWYTRGTEFEIRVDAGDGLLAGGDAQSSLTWMDAVRDGTAFTPRAGKAVEVNALWYSALLRLAEAIDAWMPYRAAELFVAARAACRSFRGAFWNAERGCLHDCLSPDRGGWRPDPRIRPNQVLALALPHCPLEPHQQRSVLRVVRERLLTPVGLRTLDPADPGYCPRYEGDMTARDRAYHNGTVWPWLLGPYAEAILRLGDSSTAAKAEARAALEPLWNELVPPDDRSAPAIGTLREVYDADDATQRRRAGDGCAAQAWSVGEALRLLMMLG